jgi:hypothetical protein
MSLKVAGKIQDRLRLTAYPENESNMMFRNVHRTLRHELSNVREDLSFLIKEYLNKQEVIN